MTTERYEVSEAIDDTDEAIIWDNEKGMPVLTEKGYIYAAPVENAKWTAGVLNRNATGGA
jgi:hypothetical protein